MYTHIHTLVSLLQERKSRKESDGHQVQTSVAQQKNTFFPRDLNNSFRETDENSKYSKVFQKQWLSSWFLFVSPFQRRKALGQEGNKSIESTELSYSLVDHKTISRYDTGSSSVPTNALSPVTYYSDDSTAVNFPLSFHSSSWSRQLPRLGRSPPLVLLYGSARKVLLELHWGDHGVKILENRFTLSSSIYSFRRYE